MLDFSLSSRFCDLRRLFYIKKYFILLLYLTFLSHDFLGIKSQIAILNG